MRALVADELRALSALLGRGRYLFGAAPCAADAAAFGVLDQFLHAGELNPQLRDIAQGYPNLVSPHVDPPVPRRQGTAGAGLPACARCRFRAPRCLVRGLGRAARWQTAAARLLPGQVGYVDRIRADFFGPRYEEEVEWAAPAGRAGKARKAD